MRDGRRIYVLGEGRLINLAAAEGHPASVMDMSFANQALCAEYMVKNHASLEKRVYAVPEDLDKQVAKMKLESMGVHIDRLTPEQEAIWPAGPKERRRQRRLGIGTAEFVRSYIRALHCGDLSQEEEALRWVSVVVLNGSAGRRRAPTGGPVGLMA